MQTFTISPFDGNSNNETVSCSLCKKDYEAINSDCKQGYGCAIFVSTAENGLWGEYGSSHDNTFYMWKDGVPETLQNDDVLCDMCVKALELDGVVFELKIRR